MVSDSGWGGGVNSMQASSAKRRTSRSISEFYLKSSTGDKKGPKIISEERTIAEERTKNTNFSIPPITTRDNIFSLHFLNMKLAKQSINSHIS